jgi:hypothetical protein
LVNLLSADQIAAADPIIPGSVNVQSDGHQYELPIRMVDPAEHLEVAGPPWRLANKGWPGNRRREGITTNDVIIRMVLRDVPNGLLAQMDPAWQQLGPKRGIDRVHWQTTKVNSKDKVNGPSGQLRRDARLFRLEVPGKPRASCSLILFPPAPDSRVPPATSRDRNPYAPPSSLQTRPAQAVR